MAIDEVDQVGDVVARSTAGGRWASADWAGVAARARRLSAYLQDHGLRAGDVVAVAGTSTLDTLLVLQAAWQCGAAVSVLPAGGSDPSVLALELDRRARILPVGAVYLPTSAWPFVDDIVQRHGAIQLDEEGLAAAAGEGWDGPRQDVGTAWPPGPVGPDDVAIYQATSGTTGTPRILPVTWGMLTANLTACADRLGLGPDDSLVSWLPLYHDMGLVGFVAMATFLRCGLTLLEPERFARSPLLLARLIERRRGTVTAGPTYGLSLWLFALERAPQSCDLTSLRAIVCGADLIDLELCEVLAAQGQRHGLRRDIFAPAYGMAEATVAVSIREPGPPEGAVAPAPHQFALNNGYWLVRPGGSPVLTGSPLSGVEVKVVSVETGVSCRDLEVGELHLRGRSVVSDRLGSGNDQQGRGVEGGSWLPTGDLGYLTGGEVVIVGRIKDVIVVGGRNVLPGAVEDLVADLPGVRRGRVAAVPAVGHQGEQLAVLVESPLGGEVDGRTVRATVRRELGVTPGRVQFVPRGSLPRTSSGKLRRSSCRDLLSVSGDRKG